MKSFVLSFKKICVCLITILSFQYLLSNTGLEKRLEVINLDNALVSSTGYSCRFSGCPVSHNYEALQPAPDDDPFYYSTSVSYYPIWEDCSNLAIRLMHYQQLEGPSRSSGSTSPSYPPGFFIWVLEVKDGQGNHIQGSPFTFDDYYTFQYFPIGSLPVGSYSAVLSRCYGGYPNCTTEYYTNAKVEFEVHNRNFQNDFSFASLSSCTDQYDIEACIDFNEVPDFTSKIIHWGDGSWEQHHTDGQLCHIYADPGIYTITVNYEYYYCDDPNPTLKSVSKQIPIGPPTASVTPNAVVLCLGVSSATLTANVTPANPNVTYLWSNSSTQQSINVAPTTTTVYTVTVTYPVSGCTTTASATVNILTNCCQGDSYLTKCNGQYKFVNLTYGDVNLSTIYNDLCGAGNIITTNRTIVVNGVLTIDNGFWAIHNTPNFTFGSNASINNTNAFLVILNSTLQACGNEMWQGIRMVGGGLLWTDNNTLIADAKEAVYLENSIAGCYLWNTRFYRNNVAVRMQNLTNPTFDMQSCTIKFDPNDALTYPLLSPFSGNRPDAGILMGLCDNVTIGNTSNVHNTFDGLNCGIAGYFSNFTVNQNYFRNIRAFNGSTAYYGSGIYGYTWMPYFSSPASATIKTVVGAVTPATTPTFLNCDTGVYMYAMNADIDNNKMQNVNYGVMSMNGYNQNFYVKNTRMENTDFGVTINNSPGCRNRVQNNYITVNNPTPAIGGLARNTYGISQQETSNAVNSNTQIFQDTVFGGRSCVQLNTCRNTLVQNCFLYQTQGATVTGNQSCVYSTNCDSIYINSNTFTGNVADYDDGQYPAYTSNKRKSGVEFFNSRGVVCSNTANTIGYGFNFVAGCNGSNVRNNTINSTKYGLTLKQSGSGGIIGQQGDTSSPAGNVFGGPFNNPSGYMTYTFNSDGKLSPFYRVQPTDYPSSNGSNVTNWQIITWACNPNPTNYSCAVGQYNKTDGGIVFTADDLQTEHDIAEGNTDAFAEAGFEEGVLWLSQKNLFDRLAVDYDLRNADAALEAFYNANTASAYGRLKALDELKSEMLLTAEKDSLSALAMLADLQSQNSLLNKNVLQEANHQLFNEIYLSTLNPSFKGFNTKQKDALFTLANSCPYVDGDAVYRARTLYAQIDNSIFFDNEVLCAASKVAYKKENEKQQKENKPFFAQFAPNPARGYTSLIYLIEEGTTATLLLVNQLGQNAVYMQLNGNVNRADVPVANLTGGIYFYKVTNHAGETLSGKLNIFK